MKTAPAFQFYPSDFLGGTIHMSAEEVGALIRLLCHQWHQGSVPGDPVKLERIAGVKHAQLTEVLAKFRPRPDGSLANRRMEDTRKKIEGFRQKQTENGRKGGRPAKSRQNPTVLSGFAETEPRKSSHTPFQAHSQSHVHAQHSANAEPPIPPEEGVASDVHVGRSGRRQIQPRTWEPTAEQLEVGSWFYRRPDSVWTRREIAAWNALGPIAEQDLIDLRTYYLGGNHNRKDIRRRDMLTLLLNWSGELDRAHIHNPPTPPGLVF